MLVCTAADDVVSFCVPAVYSARSRAACLLCFPLVLVQVPHKMVQVCTTAGPLSKQKQYFVTTSFMHDTPQTLDKATAAWVNLDFNVHRLYDKWLRLKVSLAVRKPNQHWSQEVPMHV